MPDVLALHLHGRRIATVTRLVGDRNLFAFDEAYAQDSARPTLSLSFKDTLGELIVVPRTTQTRLPPFLANLLPEGTLRDFLARRAGVDPVREFFLLRALGADLPGALSVVALSSADAATTPPEEEPPTRSRLAAARRARPVLRFSLAGVQLKFSALPQGRRGLTIPADGVGGSWIVKLPSPRFDAMPENEFAMMDLAALVGMNVPPIRLIAPRDIEGLPAGIARPQDKALAIERFDRRADGSAVHMEDFAQVFGVYPERKYDRGNLRSIARVLAAETGEDDVAEFVRRLVFNALIGNADMHLKNWSLLYPDRRRAQLAPAYDFLSTIAWLPDPEAALNVSRTKRFDELDEAELVHLADKALLPRKPVLDTASQTVALFHQHWRAQKKHLPLSRKAVAAIDAHLRTIPLTRK